MRCGSEIPIELLERPEGFARETDYCLDCFLSWCPHLAGKRVALYGSGANARHILEHAPADLNIVAIADDAAVGSSVGVFMVASLADVLEGGIDVVVVAAKLKSEVSVFGKIADPCNRAGVRVYDMYGNDMRQLHESVERSLSLGLAEQFETIAQCDALVIDLSMMLGLQVDMTIAACLRRREKDISCCIRSIVQYVLSCGKDVVLYSADSFITAPTVRQLIEKMHLPEERLTVFLAGEGLWPENGLFRIIHARLGEGRVVHVGSDVFNDCFIPLAYGMHAVLAGDIQIPIRWDLPVLRKDAERAISKSWLDDQAIFEDGEPVMRLRESILSAGPSVQACYGERAAHVASIIAPLIVGFAVWLADCLSNRPGEFDKVLFASRDGYIVKQVYDLYRERCASESLPPSCYFYTSRAASGAAASNGFGGKGDYENALRYFNRCGLLFGHSYAFVDFVGAGTCQKLLDSFAPFRLCSFNFGFRVRTSLMHDLEAFSYMGESDLSFVSRYLYLEPYLSSPEPSVERYGEGGSPVFARELRSAAEIQMMQAVHQGVLAYARRYFDSGYESGDRIDHAVINVIMPYLDSCDMSAMKLYDDLSGMPVPKQVVPGIGALDERPEESDSSSAVDASAVQVDELSACTASYAGAVRTDAPCHGEDARGLLGEDARAEPATSSTSVESPDWGTQSERTPKGVLLDLLAAFDEVCREFNLAYVATHGSLLGAVRQGGFVAGDDDLDVAMPRADFDKLLSLAAQGVFPDPFFLQTPENDPDCFFGGYAKLRDSSTAAIEPGNEGRDFNQGIWMDIMPLDDCPANDDALLRRRKIVRVWQRALYAKTYGVWSLAGSDPYKMSAYYALGDKLSRASLCKCLRHACTSCRPSGLLTIFAGNYSGARSLMRFRSSDIADANRVPFENTTVPIPAHAEEWLTGYYGPNWRTASDSYGASAGHDVLIDANRSYRDVLAGAAK